LCLFDLINIIQDKENKMKKLNKSSNGFGALNIMIAILTVLVIGVVGWYVIDHKNKTHNNSAATPSSSTESTSQPNSIQLPASAPTYLSIKEWGVSIPLSSGISDAYYVVNSSSVDAKGTPSSVLVGLKSLDSNGCATANTNSGQTGALGLIGRSAPTEKDPVSGDLITKKYPNGTTIGNYYYFFQDRTNGLTCASAESLQNISFSFAAAAKNITAN
jgi:hypothetical protein